MPPTKSQSSINPNDAAANLAFATHLSTQLAAPQAPPEAQNAPVEAPQTPDLTNEVEALQKQVESLQKEIKKDPKDDLAEIKKMVQDALAEDDSHEPTKA